MMSPGSEKRARRSSSPTSSRHRRRRRGGGGRAHYSTTAVAAVDWFVPVPSTSTTNSNRGGRMSETERIVWVSHALHRAHVELGYTHIALTHTVYGRPQHPVDAAHVALPASLWQRPQSPPQPHSSSRIKNGQVLRRLHIVVETLSDTGLYTTTPTTTSSKNSSNDTDLPPPLSTIQKLLQDYDLISIQPRNEACFQAACRSVNPVFDIVSVDHDTSGSIAIRTADVQALLQNNDSVAIELGYAPAIAATPHARRRWMQTCRAVYQAATSTSTTASPRLLLSSGPGSGSATTTTTTSASSSSLLPLPILRSPADMVNVLTTVCGWTERVARAANTTVGTMVWERAQQRRSRSVLGDNNRNHQRAGGATGVNVQSVTLVDDDDDDSELWTAPTTNQRHPRKEDPTTPTPTPTPSDLAVLLAQDKDPSSAGDVIVNQEKEDNGNDGYIAF